MTVDAEEADRLELSRDVIAAVHADPSLDNWNGYGLAVQAYQKRAPFVIDWLAEQAQKTGRRFCVRLVKGAYWDSEIKRAQEGGHAGYPVYTRKPNTDVSYLACARRLFDHGEAFYPAFATHNAHTIAAIHHLSNGRPFEFQRLHGMGADLYDEVVGAAHLNIPCRVYAPVGSHEDLLPYLVRRLLENGANTSFVNRIVDESLPIKDLVDSDPVDVVRAFPSKPHPRIPQPINLFGDPSSAPSQNASSIRRKNSMGVNFGNDNELKALADAVAKVATTWRATPLVPGATLIGEIQNVTDPSDRRRILGTKQQADAGTMQRALSNGVAAQPGWDLLPAASRAKILEHAADLVRKRAAPNSSRLLRARSRQRRRVARRDF